MGSRSEGLVAASDGLPLPRRLWAIVSISAGSVLYTLDGGMPNVALPIISDKLGVPQSSAVLLVSAYNLVLAMTLLPLAAIGERMGHRRVFAMGMAAYIVASLGCLLSTGLPPLIAFRAFQALAAAGLLSVSMAMVRLVYPQALLGRGLGFNTMAASLGAAVAPPLGGLILAHAPWQTVFAAGIPLALLGLAASRALPEPEPRTGAYDTRGAVYCALTFGLLITGLQSLTEGVPAWLSWSGIIAGGVVAIAFVRHERRVELPVLPVDLLVQRPLALSIGAALLAVLASTLLMLYLPFLLHDLGFGIAAIGSLIAPYAIVVMIAAPTSGMLSDRVPASVLGSAGLAIATAGILVMAWIPTAPGYWDLAWRIALCGLGFSLFFSPNARLVIAAVSRDRAAGASSLVSTTRMFGQALASTGLAGLLALRLPASAPLQLAATLSFMGFACSAARIADWSRKGAVI